jgi:hypothetical protein
MNNPYYDTKPYHFGFLLGSNLMDFRIQTVDDYKELSNDSLLGVRSSGQLGFTVGIVSNLKLHEFWDLRFVPTISFGARRMNYLLQETPDFITLVPKGVESTTVDFPLEVKWKGMRDGSLRPYVIGGFRYGLDMASNAKKKEQNLDEVIIKLKKNDLTFTTGVGFDFYIPYGNKIALEIKMGFGINDLLVRENNIFTNGIQRLTSRNLQIAITFE